jgi:hypothetical protein
MTKMLMGIGSVVGLAAVLNTVPAVADLPPPDACSQVGKSCDTAGPNADAPGVCTTSECTRGSPSGAVKYECLRCVAGTTNPNPKPNPSKKDREKGDSSGCRVGHFPKEGWLGGGMFALGFAALAFARRRR